VVPEPTFARLISQPIRGLGFWLGTWSLSDIRDWIEGEGRVDRCLGLTYVPGFDLISLFFRSGKIIETLDTLPSLESLEDGSQGTLGSSVTYASADMEFETLSAKNAAALDRDLMSVGAFSLDQLMELAGLSVSQAGMFSIRILSARGQAILSTKYSLPSPSPSQGQENTGRMWPREQW